MNTKSTLRELVVALGEQRYRVERPFGSFETGRALVSDVACDSRGHIYVLLRIDPLVGDLEHPVVELDRQGRFVRAFGAGEIADAHMMAVDSKDQLFVVDRDAHQVVIFASSGRKTGALGARGEPNRPFSHPSAVAFGPDESIYVADGYGAQRIHRFSPSGDLLTVWGERGDKLGHFSTPHGIWVLADGRVLVADRENDRVQVFSASGAPLEEWRHLPRAMDIWSDRAGHVYVTDQVPTLTRFDARGGVTGCCRPILNGAHGICGDDQGHIFLAEVSPSRLTRLVPIDGSPG